MSYKSVERTLKDSRGPVIEVASSDEEDSVPAKEEIKEKGILELLLEGNQVNEEFEYYETEIDLCIRALLKRNKIRYRDDCDFVLQSEAKDGLILDAGENIPYLVAYIPTVETRTHRPIDYYLSKSKQTPSSVTQCLKWVVNQSSLNLVDFSQTTELAQVELLKSSGEKNEDVIKSVLRILRDNKFDKNRLLVELYNLDLYDVRHDVFDEIIPIISALPNAHVKILMSFNVTNSHWMLCEIKITKIGDRYVVKRSLFDPQSLRKFTAEQIEKVESAIRTQITLLHDGSIVEFQEPLKTEVVPPARQAPLDVKSCGPIVIKDWECRLFGRALQVKAYPNGARDLRLALMRLVEEELGEGSVESVISFINKNLLIQQGTLFENIQKTGKSFNAKKYIPQQSQDTTTITPAKLFGLEDVKMPVGDFLESSLSLANYLLSNREDSSQRTHALSVADRSITLFKDCNKNWIEIVEVHSLARVPELQIRVNDVFFMALHDEHIVPVKMMLLSGFVEVLRLCLIQGAKTFDQDTILGYLKLINNVLNTLHSKNPNVCSLQIVMSGLCRVIDAMVDLKFSGLKKFEIKEPLYESLSKYSSHSDPEVAFLAQYALQGLIRIESNESTGQMVLRKLTLVSDALASVGEIANAIAAAAITGGAAFANLFKIPKQMLVFYQSIDKLIYFRVKPALWYEQLRLIDDQLRRPLIKDSAASAKANTSDKEFEVTWDFYRGFVYKLEVLIDREPTVLELLGIKRCILSIFDKSKELSPAHVYTVKLSECKKEKLKEHLAELGVQNNVFHLIYVSKDAKKNGEWYYHENMKGKILTTKKRSDYVDKLPVLANKLNPHIKGKNFEQIAQFVKGDNWRGHDVLTKEIAEAFDHEVLCISDVWLVGRLCNLILVLYNKGELTKAEFEGLLNGVDGRFDQLSGIKAYTEDILKGQNFGAKVDLAQCKKDALDKLSADKNHKAIHDDHLRCIKDCVALIILSNNDLKERYTKDLFARFLSIQKTIVDIDSKKHPIKYYKAVTNIQKEIIIALRFLVLHGPEECRAIIEQEIAKLVKSVADNKKITKRIEKSGLLNIPELRRPLSLSFLGQFRDLVSRANDMVSEEKKKNPIPNYVVFKSMFSSSGESSDDKVDELLGELRKENELYVPIEAKRNNLGNDTDMHQVLDNFLAPVNSHRVLLITGSAGSGKSMFVYNIADELVRQVPDVYDSGWKGYIPILVFLPSLKDPGNILSEVLKADGSRYGLNEYQVNHLKENARVLFIFDAVDEMKTPIDIFSTNAELGRWKHAKFIVTCRFEDREKLGVDYSNVRFSTDLDSFEHYNVSPFSETKIGEYIDKFVEKRHDMLKKELTGKQEKWQTAEPYKKLLIGKEKNGKLCALLDTPLMVSMTMVILPKYEDKLDQLQGPGSIVEEYMNLYLQRASRKLRLIKDKPQSLSSTKVNEEMKKLCIKFALALHKHGIKQIRFEPLLEISDEDLYNDFKVFFDRDNPSMKFLMAAVPLAQVETLTYQFKHERFRVHFLVEGMILKDRNTDPRAYLGEIPEDALASLHRNRSQLTKDVKEEKEEAYDKFNSDDEGLDM